MKTKNLLLICTVFACSCEHTPSKKGNEETAVSINDHAVANIDSEKTLNLGRTFEISDNPLKNIAISGTILGYNDNVASGELVLTDRTTQKIIQKLPFMLNNESGSTDECVLADDFDFDGNMDILVPNGFSDDDTDNNVVYLYDSQTKQFVKNESISNAVSSGNDYDLITAKKTLVTHRNGGSQDDYFDVFKIKNKTVCQVQWIVESAKYSEDDEEGEPTILIVSIQKTACDGEVVGVEKNYKFRPYPNNYKGERYYKKYVE